MPTLRPSAPRPSGRDRTASVLDRRSGVVALEQLRADDFHDCLEAT